MSRAGKVLHVDLTERKIEKEPTSSYVKKWFGGDAIGSAIVCNEVSPQAKAYDPENILTFNMGPLCGTSRGGSKSTVITRSPLLVHNMLLTSGMGGQFPSETKFAGYDNIIIKGRADGPVYLLINDDRVEIKDAAHLWGLDTYKTQSAIKAETKDPDTQVACIGPAGENQVAYGLIYHDINATAGRQGAGGVMGSKNLKAVAVRGTKGLKVADPQKYLERWNQYFAATFPEPLTPDHWSRTSMVDAADLETPIDIFMWGGDASNLVCPPIPEEKTLAAFTRKYAVGNSGCAFCPEQCYVRINVPGVGAGAALCAMPGEWQTRFKTYDPDLWWRCAILANKLGLDCSSTCNIISWTMKLYEEGVITAKDSDGIPMEWGSREAVLAMIEKIARKEGFGAVLADGILPASRKIGKSARRYARQVKGVEYLNYWMWAGGSLGMIVGPGGTGTQIDPSGVENAGNIIESILELHPPFPGMTKEQVHQTVDGLRSAKSAHMSGDSDAWKLFEEDGQTMRTTGKALLDIAYENQTKLADLAGVCDQSSNAGPRFLTALRDFWQEIADFLTADLGVEYTPDMLKEVVNRARLQERGYDYLCGLRREDETMPEDFFKPMKTRQFGTRVFLTRELQEKMKNEYYELRGCDPVAGVPRREVLEKLGLNDLADKLSNLDFTAGTAVEGDGASGGPISSSVGEQRS
ncbi:MAG: Aldehyde ferredoxin oxidoreductase [Deltaproteobacteria bacterium]|nr:Aldehyde ferredoxin oxidoreductase [Deltaproteobacteria bacterium]